MVSESYSMTKHSPPEGFSFFEVLLLGTIAFLAVFDLNKDCLVFSFRSFEGVDLAVLALAEGRAFIESLSSKLLS